MENTIVMENGLKYLSREAKNGKYQLLIWQPRAKKPYYNFIVTQEDVSRILIEHKERLDSWNKLKQERRNENKATPEKLESVKPNDIFICSWGWEQTNVDFYKIISRKGRKIVVRQIGAKIESNDTWGSGKKVPSDNFLGEEQTFTLTFYGNKPQFKISSFETANKWSGEPCYFSEWA